MDSNNLRAQGTVEYLVIVGIVVVISLIVVGVMVSQTSNASNVSDTALKISSLVGEISLIDTGVTPDGNYLVVLKSNIVGAITVTNVKIGDFNRTFSEQLNQSSSQNFIVFGPTCSLGEKKTLNVTVTYSDQYGLSHTQVYSSAVSFTCEMYTINSGAGQGINPPVTPPVIFSDTIVPVIVLQSPSTNLSFNGTVDFNFLASDNNAISQCVLRIDGVDRNSWVRIDTNTYNVLKFNISTLSESLHTWDVNCLDFNSNWGTTNGGSWNIAYDIINGRNIYFTSNTDFNSGNFYTNQTIFGSIKPFGELDWNSLDKGKELSLASSLWDQNLIALWHLNDKNSSGGVINSVTSTYDAILTNGADVNSTGLWDTNSGLLDGINDRVVSNVTNQLDSTQAGTISAWIKTIDYNGTIFSYSTVDSNTGNMTWGIQNGKMYMSWQVLPSGAWPVQRGTVLINDGKWHHVAYVADGSNAVKFYIDGVLDTVTFTAGSGPAGANSDWTADLYQVMTSNNNFQIGSAVRQAGAYESFLEGTVEEVAVWNRSLSQNELTSLYKLYKGNWVGDGLVAYYKFNSKSALSGASQPNAIQNLALWVKADAITGLSDGQSISSWNDLSGNSRNFTQATSSRQPTYWSNVLNGKPVVRLSAASSQTLTNSTNFAAPVSVIYVVRQTGGANQRMLASVSNNWLLGYWGGGKNQAYFEGWNTSSGTPTTDTSWNIYSTVISGGCNSKAYANGVIFANSCAGITGPNGLSLSGYLTTSEFSNGEVAEVIVYSRAITDVERSGVEKYLANKYGLMLAVQDSLRGESGILTNGSDTNAKGMSDTNALNLSASKNFVSVPYAPFFDTNFSISVWYNSSDVSGRAFLSNRNDGCLGAGGTWFDFAPNNYYTTGNHLITQGPTGKWNHLVLTRNYSTNNYIAYLNGIQDTTFTDSVNVGSSTKLDIGATNECASAWTRTSFAGAIDELKIYKRVLSPQEVQLDYNRGLFDSNYISRILDTNSGYIGLNGTDYNYLLLNTNTGTDKNGHIYGTQIEPATELDLNKNLLGLWHLNGNTTDSSIYARTGNFSSPVPTSTTGLWGTQAYTFNGSSNYVNVASFPGVNKNFTIAAWLNENASGSYKTYNGFMSLDGYFNFAYDYANTRFDLWDNADNSWYIPYNIKNAWAFVTIVFDNTPTQYLYVNGNLVSSRSTPQLTGSGTGTLYIGATPSDQQYTNGIIEEASIWNRPLSAAEIKELFNKGAARIGVKYRSCESSSSCTRSWSDMNYPTTTNQLSLNALDGNQYMQYALYPTLYKFPDGSYLPHAFATIRDVNVVYTN